MLATVSDSVKIGIRALDRTDLLDLVARRRREEILGRLRRETAADGCTGSSTRVRMRRC